MKLIDKIALNRVFILIGNFILEVIKLFSKKPGTDIPDIPVPPTKPARFPWLRSILDKNKKK